MEYYIVLRTVLSRRDDKAENKANIYIQNDIMYLSSDINKVEAQYREYLSLPPDENTVFKVYKKTSDSDISLWKQILRIFKKS